MNRIVAPRASSARPLSAGGIRSLRSAVRPTRFTPVRAVVEPKEDSKAAEPVEAVVCEETCSFEDSPGASALSKAPEGHNKSDLFKAIGIGASLAIMAGILDVQWVKDHSDIAMVAVFIIGYLGIILEEEVAFNKAGVALIMAVALWTIQAEAQGPEVHNVLSEKLAEVGEVVFFLIGAMTIVETVDAHQGFKIITDTIKTRSKTSLLWIIGVLTFFMSAILDNLTSTIVMVSLIRKLIKDPDTRKFYGAIVVLAANAGGAWTPIGDVTTTMLWINGQISTLPTMRDLIVPSALSLVIPMALLSLLSDEVKGELPPIENSGKEEALAPRGKLVFATGVGALLFVPVFKSVTGLPPYLGMLAGLGGLWLLTDAIHYGEGRTYLTVPKALSRIDTQGALFFLGILLSIAALDSAGLLKQLALWMDGHLPGQEIIAAVIGLVSAVIDNVPLVAATMGMYEVTQFPQDDRLWQLIAYCAGTGGSILIIGSAAGVAFMGMEKADFMWYLKKISPWALVGYAGGMGAYLATHTTATIPAIAAVTAALP